jgi:hypothetical protein
VGNAASEGTPAAILKAQNNVDAYKQQIKTSTQHCLDLKIKGIIIHDNNHVWSVTANKYTTCEKQCMGSVHPYKCNAYTVGNNGECIFTDDVAVHNTNSTNFIEIHRESSCPLDCFYGPAHSATSYCMCPGSTRKWQSGPGEKIITVTCKDENNETGCIVPVDQFEISLPAHRITITNSKTDTHKPVLVGKCPMFTIIGGNAKSLFHMSNIIISCTNNAPAISLGTSNGEIFFSDVEFRGTTVGIEALRGNPNINTVENNHVSFHHLVVTDCSITYHKGPQFVFVSGHATGTIHITCATTPTQNVLIQPGPHKEMRPIINPVGCHTIDLTELTSVLGSRYETQFYNKNAYFDGLDSSLNIVIEYETYALVALVFMVAYVHQDYWWILAQKKKDEDD